MAMPDKPIGGMLGVLMRASLESLVDVYPAGLQISIIVAAPGQDGTAQASYISTGDRDEMAAAMTELLKRWGKL